LSLINTLREAIANRVGPATAQPILDELADYATGHFAAEEALLEQTQFPALSSHRTEHQEFVEQMGLIQKDVLRTDGRGQALALSVFLNEWLINHIVNTDQQYVDHLSRAGSK
jgi:hemerythrin